ncbi:MAG: oxidoreductase [Anaerolineales bacterium]|nr:MAG: oxidoreductase [Anaerolineales bacterium]
MGQDVTVIYNVFHGLPLGVLIAAYFYLTGLSAGSFILSTLAYGFGMEKYKPLGKVGVVLAVILLGLAPICLIADLGQPLRFWHLFPYLNVTSVITWGTFLLTAYPLNSAIYGFFMFRGDKRLTKVFATIGIPLAISVHGYTGFILALSKARALWNTALMPIYFLVSAMVSGIAMMILVVIIQGKFFATDKRVNTELLSDLGGMLIAAILLDIFLVFSDILVLLTADPEAHLSALLLLQGKFRIHFLGVEILLGSLLPVVLLALPKMRKRVLPATVAAVLTMIGVFAMRYVVVIGAQGLPLS